MTTTLAPTGLAAEVQRLAAVAQESIAAAVAPNTRTTYARQWARFEAFAAKFHGTALPSSVELVVAYLAELASRGLKPSSLGVAVAAIRAAHEAAGETTPTAHVAVRRFMEGRARMDERRGPPGKAPLLLDDLRKLVVAIPDTARGARDRALLLLGWFASLRRSELVALDAESVVECEQGLEVWIGRSKANQTGPAQLVPVPYASDPRLCPVRAVQRWRKLAGITTGPLFRAVDPSGRLAERLRPAAVRDKIRHHAAPAGLAVGDHSAHSLRSGFATQAARAHKHTKAIQQHLRHASPEMTLRYVRRVEAWEDNPAAGLA